MTDNANDMPAEQGPPEEPLSQGLRRRRALIWLGVIVVGLFGQIPGFVLPPSSYNSAYWMGWALVVVGLAGVAYSARRSPFLVLWGALPVIGPVFALIVLALDVLALKNPLVDTRAKTSPLHWTMFVLATAVILALFAYAAYFNMMWAGRGHQGEARSNLRVIFDAEKNYYAQHKRYGTFEQIGLLLEENMASGTCRSCRYTYRLDTSGKPGTVIFAGRGPVTPDNTKVPAGLSPSGFTVTATANLDSDETIDQWHVNDATSGLSGHSADVSDVPADFFGFLLGRH